MKRRIPDVKSVTFLEFGCELDRCPSCGGRLVTIGGHKQTDKLLQTMHQDLRVVTYGRVCRNATCTAYRRPFLPVIDLWISPPSIKVGWDVIASILAMKEYQEMTLVDVHKMLDACGVKMCVETVRRLYRRYSKMSRHAAVACKRRVRETLDHCGCIRLVAMSVASCFRDVRLYLLWEGFGRILVDVRLMRSPVESDVISWLESCKGRLGEEDLPRRSQADSGVLTSAMDSVFGLGYGTLKDLDDGLTDVILDNAKDEIGSVLRLDLLHPQDVPDVADVAKGKGPKSKELTDKQRDRINRENVAERIRLSKINRALGRPDFYGFPKGASLLSWNGACDFPDVGLPWLDSEGKVIASKMPSGQCSDFVPDLPAVDLTESNI